MKTVCFHHSGHVVEEWIEQNDFHCWNEGVKLSVCIETSLCALLAHIKGIVQTCACAHDHVTTLSHAFAQQNQTFADVDPQACLCQKVHPSTVMKMSQESCEGNPLC